MSEIIKRCEEFRWGESTGSVNHCMNEESCDGIDTSEMKNNNRIDNKYGKKAQVLKRKKQNHSEIEKRRRDKLNAYITELSQILPQCKSRKMDKLSVLKIAVQKMKDLKKVENAPPTTAGKVSFMDGHAFHELMRARFKHEFTFAVNCSDGRILYISENVKTILNYCPQHLVGKCWFAFLHPKDVENVHTALQRGSNELERDFVCYFKFNSLREEHGLGLEAPVFIPIRVVGHIRRGDEAGTSSLVALGCPMQTPARNVNVDSSCDIQVKLTPDAKFSFLSERFVACFGWAGRQLLGTSFYALCGRQDQRTVTEGHSQALLGKAATVQCRLRHANGSFLMVKSSWQMLKNPWTNEVQFIHMQIFHVDYTRESVESKPSLAALNLPLGLESKPSLAALNLPLGFTEPETSYNFCNGNVIHPKLDFEQCSQDLGAMFSSSNDLKMLANDNFASNKVPQKYLVGPINFDVNYKDFDSFTPAKKKYDHSISGVETDCNSFLTPVSESPMYQLLGGPTSTDMQPVYQHDEDQMYDDRGASIYKIDLRDSTNDRGTFDLIDSSNDRQSSIYNIDSRDSNASSYSGHGSSYNLDSSNDRGSCSSYANTPSSSMSDRTSCTRSYSFTSQSSCELSYRSTESYSSNPATFYGTTEAPYSNVEDYYCNADASLNYESSYDNVGPPAISKTDYYEPRNVQASYVNAKFTNSFIDSSKFNSSAPDKQSYSSQCTIENTKKDNKMTGIKLESEATVGQEY